MLYTINSDTMENFDYGMRDWRGGYDVEAMSAIDAVIKASKNADDFEEVITCEDEDVTVTAYRVEEGVYEYHVYTDEGDHAFMI